MDPTAWKLVMIDQGRGESKYLEARVEGLLNNQVITDLLMKKMVVRVVTYEGEVLEEATFQSQVALSPPLGSAEYFTEKVRVKM